MTAPEGGVFTIVEWMLREREHVGSVSTRIEAPSSKVMEVDGEYRNPNADEVIILRKPIQHSSSKDRAFWREEHKELVMKAAGNSYRQFQISQAARNIKPNPFQCTKDPQQVIKENTSGIGEQVFKVKGGEEDVTAYSEMKGSFTFLSRLSGATFGQTLQSNRLPFSSPLTSEEDGD